MAEGGYGPFISSHSEFSGQFDEPNIIYSQLSFLSVFICVHLWPILFSPPPKNPIHRNSNFISIYSFNNLPPPHLRSRTPPLLNSQSGGPFAHPKSPLLPSGHFYF